VEMGRRKRRIVSLLFVLGVVELGARLLCEVEVEVEFGVEVGLGIRLEIKTTGTLLVREKSK
jgi:hypothetical protein